MINIGIIEDHPLVRRGLLEYFSTFPDYVLVGEAADVQAALELADNERLDVLLLDLNLKGRSGVDALAQIRIRSPKIRTLVYSGLAEDVYGVPLIRQGAAGFVSKSAPMSELNRAIREIAAGNQHVSSSLKRQLANQVETGDPHNRLSTREFQVFLQLARGSTVTEIAGRLALSPKTVGHYSTTAMRKIGASTASDLTYYAVTRELLAMLPQEGSI